MNYTQTATNGQTVFSSIGSTTLHIPAFLDGFQSTETKEVCLNSGRQAYLFEGTLKIPEEERTCPCCQHRMHIKGSKLTLLRHLCWGKTISFLSFQQHRLFCEACKHSVMQHIPFKASGHRMTQELYNYTEELLATQQYTNKEIASLTGLGKNTVKEIDRKRLQEKYTVDGKTLKKPSKTTRMLAIDEFLLHKGHRYATHIIDLETGHILWIQPGKKKQVVYDFIDFVGLDWMDTVEAVACDMNSDFQEAFEEKCPHIQVVYDHFHIVQNFNKQVISEVRKDEVLRLMEAGDEEGAKQLKGTRYLLMTSRRRLQQLDQEAREGKVIRSGSELFGTEDYKRKGEREAQYDALLAENKLLFTADLVKEQLSYAYTLTDEAEMAEQIIEIIDTCRATGNRHFFWFANLLENHFEGIIAHANYRISSGRMEGINNKIKTLRRQGYGYPDDEYFFLKLIDMSRCTYVRNPKSHRLCD